MEDLEDLKNLLLKIDSLIEKIDGSQNLKELDEYRLAVTSGTSPFNQITKKILPTLDKTTKKETGILVNEKKQRLLLLLQEKENLLKRTTSYKVPETFDLTLPGTIQTLGSLHPITLVKKRVADIFEKMGFEYFESRLVDDYYHVFESLNFPPNHPAADIMDTFWTTTNLVPIPHTSSMQNRILKEKQTPIAAVVFGRCMRFEPTDPRHEHTFHQLEGIYVGEGINVSHLIGTLKSFLDSFFEKNIIIKIQPSYFPFVEPGLEIMAQCIFCSGKGCGVCSNSGWLELIPCGMVHPNVLKMAGLDPEKKNGFAWAIGIDRLTMLLYGINDIRLFQSGDLRFLKQF